MDTNLEILVKQKQLRHLQSKLRPNQGQVKRFACVGDPKHSVFFTVNFGGLYASASHVACESELI